MRKIALIVSAFILFMAIFSHAYGMTVYNTPIRDFIDHGTIKDYEIVICDEKTENPYKLLFEVTGDYITIDKTESLIESGMCPKVIVTVRSPAAGVLKIVGSPIESSGVKILTMINVPICVGVGCDKIASRDLFTKETPTPIPSIDSYTTYPPTTTIIKETQTPIPVTEPINIWPYVSMALIVVIALLALLVLRERYATEDP